MERLQKIIANSGYCSRRKAEELILSGKVKVNGDIVTSLGSKASYSDTIIINGVTYSRYTDENGIARLKINLGVGYYDVYYAVNDNLYSSDEGSNNILVNGSIMTSNETTVNFGSDSYFAVQITDAYGRPIVGATIRFVISNGETLYAITDENGIARISLSNLPVGDYEISYFYDVDNAFKQI